MLVERKDIGINGVDFTSFFADTGYTVQYVRVQGQNGGLMQDGTTLLDTLKWNAIVRVPTFVLNEIQISSLLTEIVDDYVSLYYFDPRTHAYRTISAIPSESKIIYKGHGADEDAYWAGEAIAFTEQ